MLDDLRQVPIRLLDQGALVRLGPDERIAAALERMRRYHRGAVLIEAADGRLLGIFTERDVLRLGLDGGADWTQRRLADVMTCQPTTMREDEPVSEALRRMSAGHFRHLPVVDAAGHAIGLISIRDILAYVADHFPQDVINLPPDPSLESRRRWGG